VVNLKKIQVSTLGYTKK